MLPISAIACDKYRIHFMPLNYCSDRGVSDLRALACALRLAMLALSAAFSRSSLDRTGVVVGFCVGLDAI